MSSPEETNTGPVIRDRRRIDPATGQVRDPGQAQPAGAGAAQQDAPQRGSGKARPGKHSASKPGGTAGRPAPSGEAPAAEATQAAPRQEPAPGGGAPSGPRPETPPGAAGPEQAELAATLAERTADLQRVSAEYANYRKRVERDRLAVREQALANVLSELLPVLDDVGRAREHGELVGGFKSVGESLESIVTKLGLTSFGEAGEPFDPNVHEALMHSYSTDVTETTCSTILQPGYKVGDRILRPARVAVAEPSGEAGPADTQGGGAEEEDGSDGRPEPRE